jgi:hypothetical protein
MKALANFKLLVMCTFLILGQCVFAATLDIRSLCVGKVRIGGNHFVGYSRDLRPSANAKEAIEKWIKYTPNANPYYGSDARITFRVVNYSFGKVGSADVFEADIDFYQDKWVCDVRPYDDIRY